MFEHHGGSFLLPSVYSFFFFFFFFLSQLRCGRGHHPERQASYLHSTSHIRLTSIKKATPTAAVVVVPAANGSSNRQEVALWSRRLEVRDLLLQLIQDFSRRRTTTTLLRDKTLRVTLDFIIHILKLATKQKVPLGSETEFKSLSNWNTLHFSKATTTVTGNSLVKLTLGGGRRENCRETFNEWPARCWEDRESCW